MFNNYRSDPQVIDIHNAKDFEPAIRHTLSRPSELMAAINVLKFPIV